MNYFTNVLKNYATFSGRATRSEYWYFFLIVIIINLLLMFIDAMIGTYNTEMGAGILSSIFGLAILIPSIAVTVRRLHDTNRTGWWYLIIFIPILGAILLLIYLVTDSKEENKYGENPKKKLI